MSTDETTRIEDLKKEILHFARERDWIQFHSPKNLSMALAAEAGELMEHFLWSESSESLGLAKDKARTDEISEELADVIIYAIEFANIMGLDISQSIRRKIEINGQKYPVDKAKGNSLKYTEL